MFPWLKKKLYLYRRIIGIRIPFGITEISCVISRSNHLKDRGWSNNQQRALLQSIRPFNRKPDFYYRSATESVSVSDGHRAVGRAQKSCEGVLYGDRKSLKGYEKKVISVANKAKLEWYLEREMDCCNESDYGGGEKGVCLEMNKRQLRIHVIRKWSDNETE